MGAMNKIVLFNCDLEPIILLEARGALHPLALRDLNGAHLQVAEPNSGAFQVLLVRSAYSETYILVAANIYTEKTVRRILDDAVRHEVPGADYLTKTLGLYS